ncbi:MAG: o-succinylbenzoate synthase, partial [Brasilonema sp.]
EEIGNNYSLPITDDRLPITDYPLPFHFCYLLPAGEAILQDWETVWDKYKISPSPVTFKWKIGISPIETEIKLFWQLIQQLPSAIKLRLDANGGLSLKNAKEWLKATDEVDKVEFVEQPLSPQQFDTMLELSANHSTPLALDESVATLKQLEDCYQKGWRGIFVIKPAIAGSPKRLRQFFQQHQIDAVFSSVLETKIGQEAALRLAKELSYPHRALGFGIEHLFKEEKDNWLENLWAH